MPKNKKKELTKKTRAKKASIKTPLVIVLWDF